MELPIHAIQLPERNEFSRRFNYVGELFQKAYDASLPPEEQKKWEDEYHSAKYCLEQGLPMSFLTEIQQ